MRMPLIKLPLYYMSLNARLIEPDERARFEFLAEGNGTIFHNPHWVQIFDQRLVRVGIFDKKSELVGGFYMFRETRFGITILRDPPNTPDCGPFWERRAQHQVAKADEARTVIDAMATYLDELKCPLIYLTLSQSIKDTLPFWWKNFRVIPRCTYLLSLRQEMQQIRTNMSSGFRNHLSKAKKDGLQCKLLEDFTVIEALVLKTFNRQGKDPKSAFVKKILFNGFAGKVKSFAFATFRDATPLACVFVIHDGVRAVNLMAGYDPVVKHSGAGVLSLYSAIEHAQQLGLDMFDFEGSMLAPVEQYFRNFGGEFLPYFTINRGWLPLEILLKLRRRNLF